MPGADTTCARPDDLDRIRALFTVLYLLPIDFVHRMCAPPGAGTLVRSGIEDLYFAHQRLSPGGLDQLP